MSNTKLIDGRRVRWHDERAAEAYARGWWVRGTMAESLADAARQHSRRYRSRASAQPRCCSVRAALPAILPFVTVRLHHPG